MSGQIGRPRVIRIAVGRYPCRMTRKLDCVTTSNSPQLMKDERGVMSASEKKKDRGSRRLAKRSVGRERPRS